jgi:hypothetical protein
VVRAHGWPPLMNADNDSASTTSDGVSVSSNCSTNCSAEPASTLPFLPASIGRTVVDIAYQDH